MQMPNLVLITLEYPPERGGVARYLGSLVTESNGEIEVVVESYQEMRGPGIVKRTVLFRNAWPRWWPVIRVCRSKKNAVILVSHVLPIGTAAWISHLFGGPPYAVLFHGLDVRRVVTAWKRWLVRRIVKRATALIVNSEATARELKKIVSDARPVVMTPGVRKPSYPIDPVSKTIPRVISVARLVSRKGLDVAIQAVAKIQREIPIEYVIIGDGPDLTRLEDIAARTGAQVRWISRPSDELKWSWFASSDIFLLPVRDEGDDVEGFGIVFLEAGSLGIPSIAGRSGGATEAVLDGETGIIVDPTSVEEVECALRRLLSSKDIRTVMGENAKRRIEREFQWKDRWRLLHDLLFPARRMIDIAVVIPCWKHATELRKTLDALARQTLKPVEVFVVDDGSPDNPEVTVRAFSEKLPIQFVRFNANRGAPAARNEGFWMTTSPFVMFLDADVELVPQALERLAMELWRHPDADVAYANFFWGSKFFRSAPWSCEALRRKNFIHTSALIRRSAFPGFDESLRKFQDWDLWLTMSERGSHGLWINEILSRIEPRRSGGVSRWLPSFLHRLPWPLFGWMPGEIRAYRDAEKIVQQKHGL